MVHPLAHLPTPELLQWLCVCVVVCLLFGGGQMLLPLRSHAAPYGVVSLELAGTPECARKILESWGQPARQRAAFGLGLDFAYLLGYSTLLAIWAIQVGRDHPPASLIATIAGPIAWLMWGAGLLDFTENLGLLYSMTVGPTALSTRLARWCSVPKFSLIGLGVLFCVAGCLLHP